MSRFVQGIVFYLLIVNSFNWKIKSHSVYLFLSKGSLRFLSWYAAIMGGRHLCSHRTESGDLAVFQ